MKKTTFTLTPLLGWLMGVGFFMIAPFTILTLNNGYKQPAVYGVNGSWDEVNLASWTFFRPYLITWLCLMLTLGSALALHSNSSSPVWQISRIKVRNIILGTMVLSALDWGAAIWLQGGLTQLLLSNWYLRNTDLAERFGFAFVAYTRVALINQMIFTAAASLYTYVGIRHRSTRWKFTVLIILFFLIELVVSGNRIFFALYLLALLASAWICGRKKVIAALLLVSPAIALTFSVWAAVRSDLTTVSESGQTQAFEADVGDRTTTHLMAVTEGSGVMLLMHMIDDFGVKFNYLYGSTYARPLTILLPSSISPGRPPDFTTLAAQLYEPGETTSLGSTALGEAYANFGIVGILVLPALTWFAAWSGKLISQSDRGGYLMSVVSFVMFVGFVRFPFAENALTWIAALITIWALKLESGLASADADTGVAVPDIPIGERNGPLPADG